jgi:hypothetical protein
MPFFVAAAPIALPVGNGTECIGCAESGTESAARIYESRCQSIGETH